MTVQNEAEKTVVVIADDEYEFLYTVIDWLDGTFDLDGAQVDAAVAAVGSEDSTATEFCLTSADKKFLLLNSLDGIWDRVSHHMEDGFRVVVLLDLGWGGTQDPLSELQKLRTIDDLKHYPVVIYSKSDTEDDILRSYSASANAYVVKGGGPTAQKERFQETLRSWNVTFKPPLAISG